MTGTLRRERIALIVILGLTSTAQLWRFGSLGFSNQYYASVAQSGARSLKAFFFATPDLAALTGTDKPPLAMWPMALSVKAFGLHGWSVALPQAIETVTTVALVHACVRHLTHPRLGAAAALIAAVVMACTPIALALGRFNDPDTLLTLLITASAYAVIRARDAHSRWWLIAVGATLGGAFLTKWLAAAIPAPALLAALLWPHPPTAARLLTRRLRALAWVAGSAAATGLPWVGAFLLTPADRRPFPDSASGSVLDLVLGQNGVNRFSSLSGARPSQIHGEPGPLRLVTAPFAGQIGWFLPLAAIILLVMLWCAWRQRRPSTTLVLFGGWLALTAGVFSLMSGAMHPYYTVLCAPAIAALVGVGVSELIRTPRVWDRPWARAMLAAAVVAQSAYAAIVLRTAGLSSWALISLIGGLVAGAALVLAGAGGKALTVCGALVFIAALIGPTTFALSGLNHAEMGANPIAGPRGTERGHEAYEQGLIRFLNANQPASARFIALPTSTSASALQLQSGLPVTALGGFTGHAGFPRDGQLQAMAARGDVRYLVLAGPYAHRTQTPLWLERTPLGRAMTWAVTTHCIETVPGSQTKVVDLAMPPGC